MCGDQERARALFGATRPRGCRRFAGCDGELGPACPAAFASSNICSVGCRTARRPSMAYAELHCHSNFSFLDGASHPEELVEEAVRLGLTALALTDHDGFYGVVRFAEAARFLDLPT